MIKYVEKARKIPHEKIFHYDLVVLGGGPAGLTASIYSSRYEMKTAVITLNIGGMANLAPKIENYPGYEGSGYDLMQKFHKQSVKYGTDFLHEEIRRINKDKNGFVIETKSEKQIHTKTILIALGTERKKLKIPGEDEFIGRGISYCVTCDGNFFKNKVVAIIGGGNAACGASIMMSDIAKKVYLIYRGEKLKCEPIIYDKIHTKKKIELIYNAVPKEISGKEKVEEIVYSVSGKKKKKKIDGVFIEIGAIPVTFIAQELGVKVDGRGYVEVDEMMDTNVPGVFAAGDAVQSKLKQVVVAASQGAIAARSAYDYISTKE
jgi:thioredoxin reductase (NADPH)